MVVSAPSQTVEWILDFTRQRTDVMRFFRSTWIPDETFFQTLVRHLVPESEIETPHPDLPDVHRLRNARHLL